MSGGTVGTGTVKGQEVWARGTGCRSCVAIGIFANSLRSALRLPT